MTFTTGDGSDDANVTFTGQVDAVNAALATLSYQGQLNYNGADQLSVTVNDQGNTGAVSALSDTGTVDIAVQAVNDAPQLTLPGAQSVNEDVPLAISGIAIDDVDVAAGDLQVTLSVDHGALTFGDTTGLTFTTGDGSDDANVTFTGQVDAVNAALATLSYQGQLNYNGADQLSVTVNDQGNTGAVSALSDTGTVDIAVQAVNDAPTTNGIPDVAVNEDTQSTSINLFAAFDDVEQPDRELHYAVTNVTNPALFQNVVVDRAHGLLVLRYIPNVHGTSDITVTVTDSGGLTVQETFTVEVASVNDAPEAAPNTYSVRGDEVLTVDSPGLLGNDSDVDGDKLSAILVNQPQHGQLVLNADGSFRYVPDPSYVGFDTFAYVASDGQAKSERVQVLIKVAAPTSPVDPGSGPSTGTNPTGATQPGNPSVLPSNLTSLVAAELPDTVSSQDDTLGSGAHDRGRFKDDGASNVELGASGSTLGFAFAGSDDFGESRGAARVRHFDDVIESISAPLEIVPVAAVPDIPAVNVATARLQLDQLDTLLDDEGLFQRLVDNSALTLATSLTVGYVLWTVRAGYLLTGLIAQMPAWRFVDPLPILSSLDGAMNVMDGESLESIVQSGEIDLSAVSSQE